MPAPKWAALALEHLERDAELVRLRRLVDDAELAIRGAVMLKAENSRLEADCDARVTAAQVERDVFRVALERMTAENKRLQNEDEKVVVELRQVLLVLGRTDDLVQAANLCTPGLADLARERMAEIERLTRELAEARLQHQCSEGVLSMTVYRLGGIVEGNPTGRHNFLQRVDELCAIEQREATLRAGLKGLEQRLRERHHSRCADELSALLAPETTPKE